jgi:hypothetical protein
VSALQLGKLLWEAPAFMTAPADPFDQIATSPSLPTHRTSVAETTSLEGVEPKANREFETKYEAPVSGPLVEQSPARRGGAIA